MARPAQKLRRERLEVDVRQAQLLELGLKVFSEKPYDQVSIEEFARAAGVSKGLMYHYFPTKRDLYVAALQLTAAQLLKAIEPAPGAAPETRLEASLQAYLDFVSRQGPSYVALIRGGTGLDPAIAAIVERTRSTLARRILALLPREGATPLRRAAVRGWIGLVEAMVTDWITRRAPPRGQLAKLLSASLFDLVLRAHEAGAGR